MKLKISYKLSTKVFISLTLPPNSLRSQGIRYRHSDCLLLRCLNRGQNCVGYSDAVRVKDHLKIRLLSTIWIPIESGIQIPTVLFFRFTCPFLYQAFSLSSSNSMTMEAYLSTATGSLPGICKSHLFTLFSTSNKCSLVRGHLVFSTMPQCAKFPSYKPIMGFLIQWGSE